MVLVPTLPIIPDGFVEQLSALTCPVLIGPRSGSKTTSLCIPDGLAPGKLRELVPLTVTRVESLRDGVTDPGDMFDPPRWREDIATELEPEFAPEDTEGVVFKHGTTRYVAGWPGRALLRRLIERMAGEADIPITDLPKGLRIRRSATHIFVFNYSANPCLFEPEGEVIGPAQYLVIANAA